MPLYLCGLAVEGGSLKFLKGDLKNEDFIYMQGTKSFFSPPTPPHLFPLMDEYETRGWETAFV